ncbi:MAG TPA: ABC transporter permease, partial [Candidatus Limnocylindrales bacterium]|nr:ABC transporter permease [Candidatus Limnocylindrales bacterium]
MTFLIDLLAATLRNATPLVYGTVGETYAERGGVLNLGIEGTMYAGAFVGFAAAFVTGSPLLGLVAAIAAGLLSGAVMGILTVTFGANQHVSGIGLTIGLIGASEFANRLIFRGGELQRIDPMPLVNPLPDLGPASAIFSQYGLTWAAFVLVVPLAWWVLQRSSFGLEIRAVGENPEAADAAGVSVPRTRYLALMIGGALMAVGGAFFTLALLGSFTLDIIAGRGWVCIALVIFGRWRIGRGVVGA